MTDIIVSDEVAPVTQKRKQGVSKKPKPPEVTLAQKIRSEAKRDVQRVIKQNEKLLKRQKRIVAKKEKIKEKRKALEQLGKALTKPNAPKLVTEELIRKVNPIVQKEIVQEENVLFKPNPGPQTDFLSAPETDVLYGGAAGGGKSFAMLVDPLRYADNPSHRALLLRKTMPELTELIDISRQLYPKAFPKARFKELEKRWIFPSGATLQFSYVDIDPDVHRFQGQSFTWIGIDELTHYSTPYVWNYLRSRLRRTDMSIVPYLRATTNPGGVGGWWVKKMYIDPAPPGVPFWATDPDTGKLLTYSKEHPDEHLRGQPLFKRKFIPARLTDNPYLMKSGDYMAMLSSLPEVQRKRLLEGDWDISENSAFPEFNKSTHVLEPMRLPTNWAKFRACDYGYTNEACVLWFAVAPDQTLYVYRELYAKGMNADHLSYRIRELEVNDVNIQYGILDSESWSNRGQIGPSIAEIMIQNGISWRKADKGPGSRKNGKAELHRRLAINPQTNKPGILIFNTCQNLIRTIQTIPLDENDPEDVDTKAEDHAYDAIRYGINSRPRTGMTQQEMALKAKKESYQPFDSIFGY
jgi:hypothetical protein